MLTFNGTNLLTAVPGLVIVDGIKGRGPINQDIETISVPGRPGAYYVKKNIPVRTISVPIELNGLTMADVRTKVDQLNAILKVDSPAPMVFNDESNRTYYGILAGNQDWTEVLFRGKGTLNFTCTDPFKYGSDNTTSAYTESTTLTVNGNEPADPVTTIVLSADTTYIALYNSTNDKMNLIGMPIKEGETQTEKETNVLNGTGANLTGWTTPASTEDGPIVGTMAANGDFYPSAYGTGTGWHGPASKSALSASATDFRVDIGFTMTKTAVNQAGGVVLSLLDGQNNVLAKAQMYKHFPNVDAYYASFTVGKSSNNAIPIRDKELKGSSFDGIMRITRTGTSWIFQLFKRTNGVYKEIGLGSAGKFKDTNSLATAAATQAQIQFLQRGTFATLTQKIGDVKVWKLNTLTAGQVPYVARNGDTVIFDHKTNKITCNGLDISETKAFIGEYWQLTPGSNTLIAEPYTAFSSVTTTWTDRWQ